MGSACPLTAMNDRRSTVQSVIQFNLSHDILPMLQGGGAYLWRLQRQRNLLVPRRCSLCVTFTQRPSITVTPWDFRSRKIWGEPPSFAILKRDDVYVMVKQIKDHKYIVPRSTVYAGLLDMYFWVDDVDALYKECPLCACPLPGHSLPTHLVPAPTTAIRYRPFKAYVRIDAKCQ